MRIEPNHDHVQASSSQINKKRITDGHTSVGGRDHLRIQSRRPSSEGSTRQNVSEPARLPLTPGVTTPLPILVADRSDTQRRLRWHLHDLFGDLGVPVGALDRTVWLDRLARRLSREPQGARVRIAREQIRDIKAQTRRIRSLVAELDALVGEYAPQLLAEVGCGPLTAAKLIGEIAGADRFGTDAQLARTAGVATVPVSSGRSDRHRLDRGGNRQLNLALHRLAVNTARLDPVTAAYLRRKQAEGKSRMEALRCLKRYLARRVYRLLATPAAGSVIDCRSPLATVFFAATRT